MDLFWESMDLYSIVVRNPDSIKVQSVPYETNPGFVSYRGSRIVYESRKRTILTLFILSLVDLYISQFVHLSISPLVQLHVCHMRFPSFQPLIINKFKKNCCFKWQPMLNCPLLLCLLVHMFVCSYVKFILMLDVCHLQFPRIQPSLP
jgi:hypothetical protein